MMTKGKKPMTTVERVQKWRAKHPNSYARNEIDSKTGSERMQKYRAKNPSAYRRRLKIDNAIPRLTVLKHYGGNPPKCACCGESQLEFLALDHIGGGGKIHREVIKASGESNVYNWIIKNNFPIGFQVLCHNCNMALGFYGYCPHGNEAINNIKIEETFEYNNKLNEDKSKIKVKGLMKYAKNSESS